MRARDLPTPEQILEELADRAALQIDRLAPAAFEAALQELVRYHRFLLALNASRDPEGSPFSLAEVGGASWFAPHQHWVRQYRRLFERAADQLSDDPDFIARLAHVPRQLLPRDGDFELSSAVLKSIVELVPVLAFRLEAWLAKRTSAEGTGTILATGSPSALTQVDVEVYANAVSDVIGSWEGLLHDGSSLFDKKLGQDATESDRWNALRASWQFLWQHLQDTAYLLAIAVWKQDRIGASLYRDALIRWPTTYDSDILSEFDLPHSSLILPDVLSLDWQMATSAVRPLLSEYQPDPKPDQLFRAIVLHAHSDVVLLTSALFLFWTINNKQRPGIGVEATSALLQRILDDPDDVIGLGTFKNSFRSRFRSVARLALANARWEKGNYDSALDRIVEVLDRITEKRVVTGRVFTPTTLHDRSSLSLLLLAILLAEVPMEGDDDVINAVRQLAAKMHALPEGDRSLRELCRQLVLYLDALKEPTPTLSRALELLSFGSSFDRTTKNLRTVMQDSLAEIETQRKARLKEAPVHVDKLEHLRVNLEIAILKPPAAIPLFRNFASETRAGKLRVDPIVLELMGKVPKAQFISPPMMNDDGNFEKAATRTLCKQAADLVWDSFRYRRREVVRLASTIKDEAFWQATEALAHHVGQCPILVVCGNAEGRALRQIMYAPNNLSIPLKVEQAKPQGIFGSYIATINGIEIYAGRFSPGEAWLFSGRSLEAVRYYAVNEIGQHVGLKFEVGDDLEGTLSGSIMQVVDWTNDPVIELEMDKLEGT